MAEKNSCGGAPPGGPLLIQQEDERPGKGKDDNCGDAKDPARGGRDLSELPDDRWDMYDRHRVSADVVQQYRPFMLALMRVTEADVAMVWPRPDPPDIDWSTGRAFPYHYMHHKYRVWHEHARSSAPDIVCFLQEADDSNKRTLFEWVWWNRLTYAERKSVGRFGCEYNYCSSLFRVHQLMVYLRCYMCPSFIKSISTLFPQVRGAGRMTDRILGYDPKKLEAFSKRLVGPQKVELKDDSCTRLPKGIIHYIYDVLTPKEVEFIVAGYTRYLLSDAYTGGTMEE